MSAFWPNGDDDRVAALFIVAVASVIAVGSISTALGVIYAPPSSAQEECRTTCGFRGVLRVTDAECVCR